MFVALSVQHATRMLHIFICGVPHSPVFFHIVLQERDDFEKEGKIITRKMCVWFPLQH